MSRMHIINGKLVENLRDSLRTREQKMSTLSLVVVFIAFTFSAIHALVVQMLKEDGQKLERPRQFLLLWKVLYLETKHA